jgi:trans-aconitate 2-methyltransferase
MSQDQWNPSQYEKFKAQRSQPFYDLVALIQRDEMKSAIDLGCGTGELTAHLHQSLNLEHTIGLDSSSEMLKKAQSFQGSGLEFTKAELQNFVPTEKFDLVFSNAALQWVDDHEVLLPKIIQWLNPRGQIAVQVPANFDHPSHVIAYEVSKELFGSKIQGMGQRKSVLSPEHYGEILFKHGFEELRSRLEVYFHPMSSGADVVEWTKGTLLTSFQKQLSSSDYEQFLQVYSQRLIARLGSGPYLYPFKRILFWGRLAI